MASEPRPGKIRHCWNCGDDMGFIENRFYDRMDTCGKIECTRAERDAYAEEREAEHEAVDDFYGNGGW